MPKAIAYEWSQTATHLSLVLRIPYLKAALQPQGSQSLSVVLTSCYLRVCRHPLLLELDLWGDVSFQAASITPGKDTLSIVVPKSKEGFWGAVAAGSNPQLQQQEIKERRRVALAAYADWQEQIQQQRIAARHRRKEEQQRQLWRQQKEQREWHQQQKDMQVQQVLQQLKDDSEVSAVLSNVSSDCCDSKEALPSEPKRVDKSCFLQDCSDTENGQGTQAPSPKSQLSQQCDHEGSDRSSSRDRSTDGGHEGHPQMAAAYECEAQEAGRREAAAAVKAASAPAAPVGGPVLHRAVPVDRLHASEVTDMDAARSSAPGAAAAESPAAAECTTINISFGSRRANKAPARGPRAPPLPRTAAPVSNNVSSRKRPGDLSRLQQNSPRWLQCKAARLLLGGDAAAAAETYTVALQLQRQLQKQQHQLPVLKALCCRSLAWLAMGENVKVCLEAAAHAGSICPLASNVPSTAAAAAEGASAGEHPQTRRSPTS